MTQTGDVLVSAKSSPACLAEAMTGQNSMKKSVTVTAIILFAIAVGIYLGFIYMVSNAGV